MNAEILNEVLTNGALYIARTWLRYLIVCGGAFLVFWVLLAKRLEHRRCQSKIPERSIFYTEIKSSLLGIIYFVVPSILAIPLYFAGYIKLVLDPTATSPGVMVLSFVLFIIGADAWFYWTHRAMHDSRIYRATHHRHHLSEQPSPLAGYSFSIIEGFVLGLYLPLVMLAFPLNGVVLVVFVLWFSLLEAYVHLGFEILPRWVAANPIGKFLGTSVFHNMHHEDGAYNFAVYFTWWDRVMGTIHPGYTERYEQVTAHRLWWRPSPAEDVAARSS